MRGSPTISAEEETLRTVLVRRSWRLGRSLEASRFETECGILWIVEVLRYLKQIMVTDSTADWTRDYETECGGSFLFNIQGRTLLSFFIASSAQIKL